MLCINSLKAGSFNYKRFYTPVINRFCPENSGCDYFKDLDSTTKLRDDARKITNYQHEEDIQVWKEYYKYLMGIVESFACLNYKNPKMPIKWTSALTSRASTETNNMFVDLAAVLFNIASLYSQRGHAVISSELDQEMIDDSCESLQVALDYITLILHEVLPNIDENVAIPELQKPYLIYLSKLVMAEMQYLKAVKARRMNVSKKQVFVVVYMGAYRLYKEAASSLAECSVDLPNVLQHLDMMKELCYVQALYYEVYMSKEELIDHEVHGSGKACMCLQLFMKTAKKIREMPANITKPILPILDEIEPEADRQYNLILMKWRFHQSLIPPEGTVYDLEERILVEPNVISLEKPAVDYKCLFAGRFYQKMCSYIETYKETYAVPQFEKLNKKYMKKVEQIMYLLDDNHYEGVAVASSDETGIPENLLKELQEVQLKEKDGHLQKCQEQFRCHQDCVQKAFAGLEDIQATIKKSMDSYSSKFEKKFRSYFRNAFAKSVEKYRKVIESIQLEEKSKAELWEYTKSNYYKLITPKGMELLGKVLTNTFVRDPSMESARNKLLTSYNQLMAMMGEAEQSRKYAERISTTTYALVGDYISSTDGMKDVKERYARYFAPCRAEMENALKCLDSCIEYVSTITENIKEVEEMMGTIPAYKNRRELLVYTKKSLNVYKNLTEFYTTSASTCEENKEEIEKAYKSVERYKDY